MVVDKSLSRGLADNILQELQEINSRYIDLLQSLPCQALRRRGEVQSQSVDLKLGGERLSLLQMTANHPKWRWAMLSVFLPTLIQTDESKKKREIHYLVLRLLFARSRSIFISDPQSLLSITEHAFERLYLRLNVVNALQVKEEIHDALCLSVLLLPAALDLELKQVVLPTQSGVFVCSVEGGCIVAKTWISSGTLSKRHLEVSEKLKHIYITNGGEFYAATQLGFMSINSRLSEVAYPVEFIPLLRSFSWLKDIYIPRPDPEGEVWEKARLQEMNHTNCQDK
jgi:hypothetical protein